MPSPRQRGFTLIELMIVIAVIGALASIAVPRISNLIRSGNETSTQAKLRALRSALNLYYSEQEGMYPGDLSPILQPGSRYLSKSMEFWTQSHGNASQVEYHASEDRSLDTGRWGYANDSTGAGFGTVWIECTHTDLKGTAWSQY